MKRLSAIVVLVLATTLSRTQSPPVSQSDHNKDAPDAGWFLLSGSMAKMHADMASVEPSGDDDRDFVRLMVPHHQAAIEMAKAILMSGKDPQMRRLAQEIITDQQSEIEVMKLWLREHGSISQTKDQTPALDMSKGYSK